MLVQLMEAQTPCELYAIHGHYADASECAAMMAATLGVDMVMTGHSLGRNKLEHLQASGTCLPLQIACSSHSLFPNFAGFYSTRHYLHFITLPKERTGARDM